MHRRKYLATLGSLAAGGIAAIGTGAFTSVSADRAVSVQVANDSNAFLGLVSGDTGLVKESNGTLQINLDGTDTGASGVNFDAVTQIGSHENPANEHAFKIVNQGTQSLMLKMNYYFTDTDWLDGGAGQSFINFTVYDTGDSPTGSSSQSFPIQNGYNKDYPLPHPTGSGFGSNTEDYRFNVGEEYYMVITVDTSGPNASLDDDLSGIGELVARQETNGGGYDRTNPPI
ncbi:hypothetical protein [Halorhabdus amylolytica]|uniref:hypothetical protein n=1 Tax=Halorhabdus amylolytica TaxID=2559573 RepID=UPI0010AB19F6|nr:hypothetical protein [Halorhabdus amylolytica]